MKKSDVFFFFFNFHSLCVYVWGQPSLAVQILWGGASSVLSAFVSWHFSALHLLHLCLSPSSVQAGKGWPTSGSCSHLHTPAAHLPNCHPQQLLLISRGPFQEAGWAKTISYLALRWGKLGFFLFNIQPQLDVLSSPDKYQLWVLPFHFLNNLFKQHSHSSHHSYVTSQKGLHFFFFCQQSLILNIGDAEVTNCMSGCLKCYPCTQMILKDDCNIPKSQTFQTSHGSVQQTASAFVLMTIMEIKI